MTLLERIKEDYSELKLQKIQGYDKAVIGIDPQAKCLIYSGKKILEILLRTLGPADAQEYFEITFMNFYNGVNTPVICDDNY
jgi:hypothetical protein